MSKIIMLLYMLFTNKMLAINKVSGVEGGNESIKIYEKILKMRKLFGYQKSAKSR